MASQSEVLVGAPLTVRNVDIAQEPLFAIDLPRGLYSLIHFQGTVSGRVSGTSHVNLNVLQITVPFHGELWSMYTFNGGRFDSFPPYRSAGEEVHTAGFTDIRSSGYHFYDLCPEMRRFHAGMIDRTGEYCHYDVWPFDQRQYYVSVHPAGLATFSRTRAQMHLLQVICMAKGITYCSPRYWLGIDNMMSLSDWGRWRSPSSLQWLIEHGFDNVPSSILEELQDLCREYEVEHNDQPVPRVQGRRNRWR